MKYKVLVIFVALLVIINLIVLKVQDKKEKSQVISSLKDNPVVKTVAYEESQTQKQKDSQIFTESRHNAITNAVQLVEPAVVSVNVIKTQIVRKYTNPFENPFFGFFDYLPYKREVKSIGSGVIFSKDGYIITNSHVVEGATQIKIILTDNRQFDAELIGVDKRHDIAVIKVSTNEELPCAKLGSSKDLIIGEWSIALGNPYAYLIKDSKPSVSVGVISAINRNFAENKGDKIYKKMIQTDAAINPGNSGGPLVNIYGQVIGINTFIFSESGGNVGIGFAIPVDRAKEIAAELIEYGKIREPWFGFKIQDLNQMIATYMDLDSMEGVIVSAVDRNGPADKAGLEKGDIIIQINDVNIKNSDDAELAVSDIGVNEKVKLKVIRNSKEKTLILKTVEYK